jgi:hypothetical protein
MLPLMSRLLQVAETTNTNSATAIVTQLSSGRLLPSCLATMMLNIIIIYFKLTILPSPLFLSVCTFRDAWEKEQGFGINGEDGCIHYI